LLNLLLISVNKITILKITINIYLLNNLLTKL